MMDMRPKLLALRKRLIDEQRRMINLTAPFGALPAGELQRIADLESRRIYAQRATADAQSRHLHRQ